MQRNAVPAFDGPTDNKKDNYEWITDYEMRVRKKEVGAVEKKKKMMSVG